MLYNRLISAVLGIVLVIIAMSVPVLYFNAIIAIIALLGLYELFGAFKAAGTKPIDWIGYLSVLYIIFNSWLINQGGSVVINFILFAVMMALFLHIVISRNKTTIMDISVTLLSMFYITFLLSFIILTRAMDKGNLFVWLILIGGWVTDSSAYFVGKYRGKNKLIPDISPKKTIEGAAAGVIGSTVVIVLYGLFMNKYFGVNIQPAHYLVLGMITSIFSQLGDLSASAVKRFTNIKDFGNIMPGHGGIIDRFDSILFAAPIVYFYLRFII